MLNDYYCTRHSRAPHLRASRPLDQWPGCRGRGRTVTLCSFDTHTNTLLCSISLHDIWSNIYLQSIFRPLSCSDIHWYWIKWAANSHKGISEGSLGIMFSTIQKKGFRPNCPTISFATKSKRRPLVDCRGCRLMPQAIPGTAFSQLPPPCLKI